MPMIRLNGKYIDVDIIGELEPYQLENTRITDDKIQASSPFREDYSPSFFINIGDNDYAGTWADSGADSNEWASGSFPKLLSFFRNEDVEDTVKYLLSKYDYEYSNTSEIKLVTKPLHMRKKNVEVPKSAYRDKPLDKSYLIGRGIHPKIIELNRVFDNGDSIGIPWIDTNGKIATIKYRMKDSKLFWYEKDSTPVGRLVFGLNNVLERGIKRVAVCEAEIDAMTWQSAGIYAVALGGSTMTKFQRDLIISSGIEEIILGGDFDEQGRKFNEQLKRELSKYVPSIVSIILPKKVTKDINELGIIGIKQLEYSKEKFVLNI